MNENLPEAIRDLTNLKLIRGKRYWLPFMKKYDCQKICEVGVFAGRNFLRMIEHTPQIAVAVDIWKDDGKFEHNDSKFSQEQLDFEYNNFVSRTSDKPFVKIYRDYSLNAVNNFPDEYFDFIYIDGDHTYEGTKNDIENWYKKLKKGKFFLGDDYNRTIYPKEVIYDVKRAIEEFSIKNMVKAYEIPGNEWSSGWAIIKPL